MEQAILGSLRMDVAVRNADIYIWQHLRGLPSEWTVTATNLKGLTNR